MKTSRPYRIFMMALATLVLALLRCFRKFTKLVSFSPEKDAGDEPHAVAATQPERLGIVSELEVEGEPAESYSRSVPIFADPEAPYSALDGVLTFRGDQLRSGGAFGRAALSSKKLAVAWEKETGRLQKSYGSGFWTGSGWTGQPLIVRRSEALTEVVYATMDGKIYFLNLADGSETKPPIETGLPYKGAGALDPTGRLGFFGAGDAGPGEDADARNVICSLSDARKIGEFGRKDPFALRKFHGYDSSPLVYQDTVIEPGENGLLYTFRLNTTPDENGGVSISPSELVKLRYKTARSSEERYWLGMEDSAVLYKNWLYIADNGGTLLCVDLNTMQIVWAQDVVDDTNGSPVLSVEEGRPYLYLGTSLHWKASKMFRLADVPIFKIDALTGEYVWIRTYFCNTIAGISGGVQATCALGKHALEGLVFFPVARTPQVRAGLLVALDCKTGREVWRLPMRRYAWSSPVAVYDEEGNGYLVQCDSGGEIRLIDGKTGKVLGTLALGSNIEATPAVFENTVVVGTRGQKIFGIRLS